MKTSINKPLLQSNVWKFYLSTFFGSWAFATGFLVFYYRELGFSYLQIFVIAIVYEVLNFLLEIPTGILADFWSRKRVIVIGYFISGLSFFIVLLRPDAYVTYIIWSVLSAICTTLNSGSVDAFIFDTVQEIDPDYYPKVLSRLSAIALITQAISFLIGGWVSDSLGFRYALLLSGIGGILQTLIISTTFEAPIRGKEEAIKLRSVSSLAQQFGQQISNSFRVLFGKVLVRNILLYSILFFVISEFARVIYQPYLSSLGYGTKSAISIFSSGFLIVTAISSMIIGQIKTRKNERSLLIFISAGLCLPFLLLKFTNTGIVAFVVFYVALGAGQVVIPDIMNRLIPSDKRATILSAQNQLGSISYAISALVIGALIDQLNIVNSALIIGVIVMFLFYRLLVRTELKDFT